MGDEEERHLDHMGEGQRRKRLLMNHHISNQILLSYIMIYAYWHDIAILVSITFNLSNSHHKQHTSFEGDTHEQFAKLRMQIICQNALCSTCPSISDACFRCKLANTLANHERAMAKRKVTFSASLVSYKTDSIQTKPSDFRRWAVAVRYLKRMRTLACRRWRTC